MGGKAAAEVLLECRDAGDFSARSTRLYQRRWMELFGHDFKLVSAAPWGAPSLALLHAALECEGQDRSPL
jgi:hypothetical protein